MSHPDGLPDLFLDRSLGRIQVPRLLRDAGLHLVTPENPTSAGEQRGPLSDDQNPEKRIALYGECVYAWDHGNEGRDTGRTAAPAPLTDR